jgi:hypothetical protein
MTLSKSSFEDNVRYDSANKILQFLRIEKYFSEEMKKTWNREGEEKFHYLH